MNVLATLIKLYTENSIQQIEADEGSLLLRAFRKKNRYELCKIDGYQTYSDLVIETKKSIDLIVRNHPSQSEQVSECLYLIKDTADEFQNYRSEFSREKLDVLYKLIKNTIYKKSWNNDFRKVFTQKYKIIVNWKHYFISYTNRNAGETNRKFEKLLRSVYIKLPPQERRQKENYVAKIIAKFLKSNNLQGFFDEEELQCGDEIEEKIKKYCQCCFAFIQLIEDESFLSIDTKINWCYEEYKSFKQNTETLIPVDLSKSKRYCFLITQEKPERLRPAFLPKNYKHWFDHISQLNYVSLVDKNNSELRLEINKIAYAIHQFRTEFIENLLMP